MSTGTQACDIVLPGYMLTERIGSGGYAEVWRAEAPGGIEKAVKIVYGYYDDEFASQELKALERIKGVRHPFLLSLERFEILNGRLAILTELADMSLDQRLRQCRADGLAGHSARRTAAIHGRRGRGARLPFAAAQPAAPRH